MNNSCRRMWNVIISHPKTNCCTSFTKVSHCLSRSHATVAKGAPRSRATVSEEGAPRSHATVAKGAPRSRATVSEEGAPRSRATVSKGAPRSRATVSKGAPRSRATVAEEGAPSTPDQGDRPRLRAIDLARKIQQENQTEQDQKKTAQSTTRGEKGVAEMKQFTQQLQNVHPNVLAKHLHNTLLFQNDDLVVINKPYGVPVQDNSGGTSISSVLPVLSKMLFGMKSTSMLYTCLGLEKEATGTLILAKSEEMVDHILALSKNSQVQRKYWIITVGVPVPAEGVIDIPVIERQVAGSRPHFKMGLSPVYRVSDTGEGVTRVRSHRQAQGAVTQYRVLESDGGCSLVELQPLTGVKHQMKVHMALALACPTLGDHKYSHWTKLAPQKLPEGVLGRLGLEQSKVRYLPLHLHARQTILLGNEGQPDVSVTCPLPRFFTKSLRQLRLNLSKE